MGIRGVIEGLNFLKCHIIDKPVAAGGSIGNDSTVSTNATNMSNVDVNESSMLTSQSEFGGQNNNSSMMSNNNHPNTNTLQTSNHPNNSKHSTRPNHNSRRSQQQEAANIPRGKEAAELLLDAANIPRGKEAAELLLDRKQQEAANIPRGKEQQEAANIPRGKEAAELLRRSQQEAANIPRGKEAAELLLDRTKAFEHFRKSVRRNEGFEENKELLRNLYTTAKAIGEEANEARNAAGLVKTKLQSLRLEKAMLDENGEESGSGQNNTENSAEETELLQQLDIHKQKYFDKTSELRKAKSDIERLQNLLEQNKKRLQRDFETWFVSLRKEATASLEKIVSEVRNTSNTSNTDISGVGGTKSFYSNSPKGRTGAGVQSVGDAKIDAEISGFYSALNKLK